MNRKTALIGGVSLSIASLGYIAFNSGNGETQKEPYRVPRQALSPRQEALCEQTDVELATVLGAQFETLLRSNIKFSARPHDIETSGFSMLLNQVRKWGEETDLKKVAAQFDRFGETTRLQMDRYLQSGHATPPQIAETMMLKAASYQMDGLPEKAYQTLSELRTMAESHPVGAQNFLFPIIYLQGVASLRIGENANCIMCRGESSCILPISQEAVHRDRRGSLQAIKHFTEYLTVFPDDLRVKWLLNIAYMTLGAYPQKVNPKHLVSLDRFFDDQNSIGKFVDVGARLGINRFNQAGGAIMDDFDNDGLLDIVYSSYDSRVPMAVYKNLGTGKFENVSQLAGLSEQLGGLYCVQTDYNNDGLLDIFVVRGAWYYGDMAIRPSLLKNLGNLQFEDVTFAAGLSKPVNSITAQWADYDNDGWLDLLVACEQQSNLLYHNNKDGTFTEVAAQAGLAGESDFQAKGIAWIDYNNDGYQDVFLNNMSETGGQFYINDHDGTFTKSTREVGIEGPESGFSCWAWDYNNDGLLDIMATCYQNNLPACVHGLLGLEQPLETTRLFMNVGGVRFEDKASDANLDQVLYCMGSNFGDFDGDGYLDFYLGTGEPDISSLVPNRMFRNLSGESFADISASSGTAHLQKGHGVSCGDWDNDGDVDILIEMGGAIDGDRFHNLMFQNPNQGKSFVKLKLVGVESNRAAIGVRIKISTDDESCPTIYRVVSSGSSFGANPLTAIIGLNDATKIDNIEISWPASGKVQSFNEVALNKYYVIEEHDVELLPTEQAAIALPGEVSMAEAMRTSRD